MKFAFKAICAITIVAFCLAHSARPCARAQSRPPQQTTDDDVIRVTTALVTLPVRITDRKGKVVPSLTREHFQVFEDGVQQEIAYFEPPGDQNDPAVNSSLQLTVALLLDISDSTQFKLEQIQTTAIAFLDLLRSADRVVVVAFDKEVRVLNQATQNREVLRTSIRQIRSGGGTSLYQALISTIRLLNQIPGRKAIVVLTDGVDTASKDMTWETVLREVESSHVTIYPIQYHTLGDFADSATRETHAVGEFGRTAHVTRGGEPISEVYRRATRNLRLLADKTSGSFQYSDKSSSLARSFERLASQLRQQYTIGYYPANKTADGKRKISVKVNRPDVKVNTRTSYTYRAHRSNQ